MYCMQTMSYNLERDLVEGTYVAAISRTSTTSSSRHLQTTSTISTSFVSLMRKDCRK